jgi:hypothetical protein
MAAAAAAKNKIIKIKLKERMKHNRGNIVIITNNNKAT